MSVKGIIIKTILGLLAVAILVGSIYQLLKPADDGGADTIDVYMADASAVTRVDIKGEDEYALVKDGEAWVMEGVEGVKVNQTFADTLVKSLCNIKSPMKVDSFGVKLSDYGLEEPLVTAKLDFDGKEKSVYVGSQSGEYYYLKLDADIYLVSAPDLYMVFLEKIKYLDDTVLAMYADSVTSVSYKDVLLEKDEDGWMQKTPYEMAADNDKVNAMLEEMSDISALEIVKRDEIKGGEPVRVCLMLGEENAVTFDVNGSYILFEHAEYGYKVADSEVAFLNNTGFDLVQKYIAPIAINEVKGVKFTSNEGVLDFTIEAPDSEAPVFYKNGVEVSEVLFRNLYQNLMGLTAANEGVADGIVEYDITFTKTDGGIYSVKFISASESEYVIDINGVKSFLINKKSVVDVFELAKKVE